MQAIANENNLAATAFFVPSQDGYELPLVHAKVEIDLRPWDAGLRVRHLQDLAPAAQAIGLRLRTGRWWSPRRRPVLARSSFAPSRRMRSVSPIGRGAGGQPETILAARDYLVVYSSEDEVRALAPTWKR